MKKYCQILLYRYYVALPDKTDADYKPTVAYLMSSVIHLRGRIALTSFEVALSDFFKVGPCKRGKVRPYAIRSHLRLAAGVAVGLLVVLSPILWLVMHNVTKAEAAWFNDNWLYRKKIEISNSCGLALAPLGRLFVEGNVHQQNSNRKKKANNKEPGVKINKHCFTHHFWASSNLTAKTKKNIPINIFQVNSQSWAGVPTDKKLGKITTTPKAPAAKLVNNPDKTLSHDLENPFIKNNLT